jgi:hypothetical protein
MGIIYMPNSAPLPPPPPPPKPKTPPNIPLLVGGATGSLATVGVAISAKNWLWENKWIILLAFFILAVIIYALWKAFKGDKEEEPEEE